MLSKNEIKYIRSLHDKKHRTQHGCFIAEGNKWLEELASWKPAWIDRVYVIAEQLGLWEGKIAAAILTPVEAFEMEKISALTHPSAILAVAKIPTSIHTAFDAHKWNLVLDGIQDPGNMGTIIRLADWYGLNNIWCSPDSADAYNPKVVQATMGSLCRVAVHYEPLATLIAKTSLPIFVSGMKGISIHQKFPDAGILIIGSEGKGVRLSMEAINGKAITIPRIGHAESLNAAVATGIMLSHLVK